MKEHGEIDALIIRNISEIEQAHERIGGHIERVFQDKASDIFKKVAAEKGWYCVTNSLGDDFWMVKSAWKIDQRKANAKAEHAIYIELTWDSAVKDVSWAGTFVGSQGARLRIIIDTDKFAKKRWIDLLVDHEDSSFMRELAYAGLTRDDNNEDPYGISFNLDPERVAMAFEGKETFDDAFEPLAKQLKAIVSKEEALDVLAQVVRKARE